mmetsp:Transcript_25470/g.24795  ORF Transcript_25470/g.24795 Transcript_25470/m.24795 type:complete len:106 (+) Transcript_25470:379-696(+)
MDVLSELQSYLFFGVLVEEPQARLLGLEQLPLQLDDFFDQDLIVVLLSLLYNLHLFHLFLFVKDELLEENGVLGVGRQEVQVLYMLLGEALHLLDDLFKVERIIP